MAEQAKVVRSFNGRVVSNKMDKTVVVLVERRVKHPTIGKIVAQSKKFHAHDAENACNEGDLVTIVESKPYSKTKSWTVSKIIK